MVGKYDKTKYAIQKRQYTQSRSVYTVPSIYALLYLLGFRLFTHETHILQAAIFQQSFVFAKYLTHIHIYLFLAFLLHIMAVILII